MARRHIFAVLMGVALSVACGNKSTLDPTEDSAAITQAVSHAADAEACRMLDDPAVRPLMDAALEIKLGLLCGRVTPPASSETGSRWRSGPASLSALAEQLGGTDIAVSNPAVDVGGTTQSESTVVSVGSVVCAAWNDAGEGFGSTGFSGFGFSLNDGASFTDGGPFPNGPSDTNRGDPSLAFSARDNTFYYSALSTLGLSLWKSTNNCQAFQYVGAIHNGTGDDKELMAVDNTPTSPFFGRIYVGWTDFAASSDRNVAAFSDNSGVTWSVPAALPGSGVNGQGMYPAVAPNGDVYMALLNRASATGGLQDQWIYKSTNGGVSWIQVTNIGSAQLRPENLSATAACGRQALNGNIRYLSSPQIVVSAAASAPVGYVLHSVYSYDSDGAGPDQSNVFYRRSVDGAATWSAEVRLNDDATNTDQFVPAIGVNSAGVLVASWYDRRLDDDNNLLFDRFAVISSDQGLTWGPNDRVSDVSSPVAQTNPNFDGLATCYHGDYDQVSVSGGSAHLIWSDDRRVTATGPNPDIYYDRLVLAPAITVNPSTLEGGGAAAGTVTVSSPATTGGTTVSLTSSNPAVVAVPSSVLVAAGQLSAAFSVTTSPALTQTVVTISAVFPGSITRAATITVLASPTVASLVLAPTSVAGGQPSTATVTLSGPAPAGGSVVALSSSNTAAATVPATLAIAQGAQSGSLTVNTLGQASTVTATISASLNGITRTAALSVLEAPGNATFDPGLQAPRCSTIQSFCDTGPTLVRGRDNIVNGVEPNAPNTINDSCADGGSGTFHTDESLDRLRISTTDGSLLTSGKTVRVDATVWVLSPTSNSFDLFFAPDATNPVWTPISSAQATASGQQVVSVTFTLPAGPLPAIRGTWRFGGTAAACTTGGFDDHDDLVFAVGTGPDINPPTVAITAPANGAFVRGAITVAANASDDVGVTQVDLRVDGALQGTDTSAPYSFPLDTTTLSAGTHQFQARALDAAGNNGTSVVVSIIVDNVVPTVTITAPAANATVSGNVTVSASASDVTSGVVFVEFFADGASIGSDPSSPYGVVWNTSSVVPGAHSLTARATDAAGNQTLSTAVPVTVATANQPPVVNAGPDRAVTLPAAATLSGTVTDDGLPAPPALTITWTRTSGPGTVTFANPSAASTTATFSTTGMYVLRLTASDGSLSAFDEIQVTVSPSGGTPCAGLCTPATTFTISGSYQSGNLGALAVCRETTSVVHGGNCGNFVSPRTLSVNGAVQVCNSGNWATVPAPRNGGYCIQATAGNQPWAFFTLW